MLGLADTCADPKGFVRGGPTLKFFLVYEGGSKSQYKPAIISLQRNAI